MMKPYRRNQLSKVFLVLVSIALLTGGLCLAGKPGGSSGTSLSTDIASQWQEGSEVAYCGLCPKGGPYVNGKDGVYSVINKNAQYIFTSNFSRSKNLRVVSIKLGTSDTGINFADQELPLHLAINSAIPSLNPGEYTELGMGGAFIDLAGVEYRLRWGEADPSKKASKVRVTKTTTGWEIQSLGEQKVRVLIGDDMSDSGLCYLPFKLILTDLSASAQKSAAPEDIFTWSPRGDRIAMAAGDPNGDHTIQVIDLQSGSVQGEYGRGEFASAARRLAWANRGEMLAFSANNSDGQETVFVLNLRTGNLVEIGLGTTPRWAPDDSRLIFIAEDEISIFDLNRGAVVRVPRNSMN